MLRKRLHSRMLGTLLGAVALAVFATPAVAGTYNVESCAKSATNSLAGWTYEETAGKTGGIPYFFTANNCSGTGLIWRFENTAIPGSANAAWTFHAPTGTVIDRATLYQTITLRTNGAYDILSADLTDGSRRTIAYYAGTTGTTNQIGETPYDLPQSGPKAQRLRLELGCHPTAGTCSGNSATGSGNIWSLYGTVIRLEDPSLPTITSVSGDGWRPEPADGVLPIGYTVSDSGSGVANVRFYVDGIEFAINRENCVAAARIPCPPTSNGSFSLDTTLLSEGQHKIAIVASDYSSNTTSQADKQLTITVRRPPAALGGSPVTTTNPSWNGGGSPAVGDNLSGQTGSWNGDGISYTYEWLRCDVQGLNCVAVDGATGLTYTPAAADIGHALQFCVTATNSGGAATSCSAPTPVVIGSHPTTAPTSGGGSSDATPATPTNPGGTPVPPRGAGAGGTSGERGAPNGSPASDRVVLTAIANSRSATQKVKYGKRVPITGRLVSPNGTPIAGAIVSVQVQTAIPGASMADAAKLATGSDGRFVYLAPVGPSRIIRFGYRAFTADSSFADTTDVRLLVSAGVTMKATPKKVHNRHATVFKGRLLGRPIAKRGVVVDLQVFFRNQWRTFAAPRTTKAGAYKFKYRFMAGAATWRFRARVRKETSYPYELGYSVKAVKVKVTR